MSEGLQIYKCDSMTIYQPCFYYMTKLNFMYNRRRLFSFKNSMLKYNGYFPMHIAKERIKFYGLYLSAYSTLNCISTDFDFDIGFNNVEFNFEKSLLKCLKREFDEIKIIIKIFNSKENESVIKKVEQDCDILFLSTGLYNIYIVRLIEIENIDYIKKYIFGILLDKSVKDISFRDVSYNPIDLNFIQYLVGHTKLIILKVPIYANYNMMLYSKEKSVINEINAKLLKLKRDDFNIENIKNLDSPKNFLLDRKLLKENIQE